MKVNPEKAVKSVIDYKKQRHNQMLSEQKLIFDMVKDRKSTELKKEKEIAKFYGLKVSQKDRAALKAKSEELFHNTLKQFQKIKSPKPIYNKTWLSVLASAHHKNDGRATPNKFPSPAPGPQPNPQPRITESICFASAIRCEGDQCERENAVIFPFFKSTGVGGQFGYWASAVPADLSNSLYYLFVPPDTGAVTILAEIFLTGDVVASTQQRYWLDSLLSEAAVSRADTKMELKMVLWQGNSIIQTTPLSIADLHSDDESWQGLRFRDDLFIMSTISPVVKEEWIVIEIRAEFNIVGRSDYATAYVNFEKGDVVDNFKFGIRVPQLCVFFDNNA
jgi:hypothetical protein